MKTYLLAMATIAGLTGSSAAADMGFDVGGKPFYFTLQGVYGPVLGKNDFFAPQSNAPGALSGTVNYNNGFVIGGAAGKFLTDNVRVGVELNYFTIDPKSMNFAATGPLGALNVNLGGSVSGVTAMVDVGYETKFTDKFGGFVEAGFGLMNINLNNVTTGANFNGFINDSDTVWAGKVGAGLTYEVSDRVELFSKYNLVFGEKANVKFTAPGAALNPVPFNVSTTQHSVLFGVRIKM